MTGEPKTGDCLLELVEDDMQYMKEKYDVKAIGWCTDDGPDGKKMRRLLREKYTWMIVILCWAHQINLIVGNFLSLKINALAVVGQALDIVRWFNNHRQPLAWLRAEQQMTYNGAFFALFLPVTTRWLAHYLTFSRLLKIKAAVKSCWCRWEEMVECAGNVAKRQKARETLKLISDEAFWKKLSE